MSANSLDEYWVPEHVKNYLRKLGFVLPLDDIKVQLDGIAETHFSKEVACV